MANKLSGKQSMSALDNSSDNSTDTSSSSHNVVHQKAMVEASVSIDTQSHVKTGSDTLLYLNLDSPEVMKILLAARAKVNTINGHGLSPLFTACYIGNVEVIKMLLLAKADVNFAHPKSQEWTCSAVALATKRQDVLRLLDKAGAWLKVC